MQQCDYITHEHTLSIPMEFLSKSDSSPCSHSSKSCLILSLPACYLKVGSEEGQSVERRRQETWWHRERGKGRLFILSDKEKRWIGSYHTFNWTSSLCLAGCWKWTTETCQLALRPSASPVHSCYQPPTISISLSFSLSLSLLFTPSRLSSTSTSSLYLPPSRLLFLSLCSLMDTWHIAFFPPLFVIHLNLLVCFPLLTFLSPNLSISLSSPLPAFPSVFSLGL